MTYDPGLICFDFEKAHLDWVLRMSILNSELLLFVIVATEPCKNNVINSSISSISKIVLVSDLSRV